MTEEKIVIEASVRRRNDSLFSSDSEDAEKTVRIIVAEDEEKEKKIEYTPEEIDKLVSFIMRMTTLYDLREEDWTEANKDVVKNFFYYASNIVLTVCFDENNLLCTLGYPECTFDDLIFFYRDPGEIFQVDTFHDRIHFGTVDYKVEGSILRHIELFFLPIFLKQETWPDTIKADIFSKMHTYLARLTDQHYRMYGLCILYVPTEADDIDVDIGSRDKELIKRLESVVVYWTRQIRLSLQDLEQGSTDEMLCPVEEYEFWKYRYENLSLIVHQTNLPSVKKICYLLNAVQSSYVKQFTSLSEEIDANLAEAKSNIEFLQIIVKPCEDLRLLKNPSEIPDKLEPILHTFRYIWLNSGYYNTREKISGLFWMLSNQIIQQCTDFIDFSIVFKDKKVWSGIKMFETCIDCCLRYIKTYVKVSMIHSYMSGEPWKLSRGHIFNQVDTFIQRCKDMIEVCLAMKDIGRYHETKVIEERMFGGSKGDEFAGWCTRIELMFQEAFNDLVEVGYKITDVNDTSWYDDITKFRTRLKSIDVVIENLVKAVSGEVTHVEEGIEYLSSLYYYSNRKLLAHVFNSYVERLYGLFKQEIQECKEELETEKEEYSALTGYYSGRALNAQLKKCRLNLIKKAFDDAFWLPDCKYREETFNLYDKCLNLIDEATLNLYRRWVDTIGEDVMERLNRPLLCKSATRPGLLECNIDRSVLPMIRECKIFESLKFEVPANAKFIIDRAESLRNTYECVLQVVLDYNSILSALADEERMLFKQLIGTVEKRIQPGLMGLTWSVDDIEDYVSECGAYAGELQDFVDDYKTCNMQIVSICEKVCALTIITLTHDSAFTIYELIEEMDRLTRAALTTLIDHYQDIIRYLIVVYEGFENIITLMASHWIKYIVNFDFLLEEAVRICVRNSMQYMYQQLHGDGTVGPNPLLKLEANLRHNRINFEPSLAQVEHVVSDILPGFTRALKGLPRIVDKFHVFDTPIRPFADVIADDIECKRLQELMNNEVQVNVQEMQNYLSIWEPFRDMWEVDKVRFIERYEKENPNAAQFDANIGRYTEVANNVQIQETISNVHFIVVNSTELKKSIVEHCFEWQEKLCKLLYDMTVEKIDSIYDYVELYSELVMKRPETLDDLGVAELLQARLRMEVPIQEAQFPLIFDQLLTLDKYKVEVSDAVRNRAKGISVLWSSYLEILDDAEKMLGYAKEDFKTELLKEAEDLQKDRVQLLEVFLETGPFSSQINPKDALKYLSGIRAQLKLIREREDRLRRDLGIFDISLPESIELKRLEQELATLEYVWELADEWESAWESYKSGGFWTIQTTEMEDKATTLFRKLNRLSRELKDKGWDIVFVTRDKVDAFRRVLPLIGDLKNPAMRARHWDRVRKTVGKDFDENSSDFNLEAIIAMEFQNYAEEINEISNAATMELQIEKGLEAIATIWRTMTIEMVPHERKGLYRIKSVDECFQILEENMTQLSTMKSTRFVEPFARVVDYWERALSYIMEVCECALVVQRQWLYLENIFGGEDIRKQLPLEADRFDMITSEWTDSTIVLAETRTILEAVHYKPPPYFLDKLNKMNDKLELIQRALEQYLETKRHVFPRFYFISNDDMLEILGNSKKPELVQPHLKKLFDNLNKLKAQKNPISSKLQGLGMFSEDGEYLEFLKPVNMEGPVENWLCEVEASMRACLKNEFKPCRAALKKMLNKRDKWLMENCGQLCNACSQIQWTTSCTRALMHCKIMESKKPMKRLRRKQNQVLDKLSEMSRKDLNRLSRLKVNALITIEIHCRDVIDKMYKANCMDVGAFEWFSQLKFYWDREIDDCVIKQTNTSFRYGYEYNGNSGRLVITPLTDRCYITLTTALHLYRGGSPQGPAGTGKTETVKDLGKAMGMWVIVNNCSEGLDYKSMGKCFSGLAQTGAWGCFDEFNRINIEVLSVVAQQILCILLAISQRVKTFVFEGIEINLQPTCGIFITMNPGYAGRTELPDNLKSMFRPIAMVVPDSMIIAENTLFSDGFQITKLLAKKVFTLYQLAMRQLSKQDHYDFGLRSMVALLRYAGRKRRQYPQHPEEQMVYLAMRDMNIAKLTANDLPLFNGIMSDIFPGVVIPTIDYEDMNSAITAELVSNGWQPVPIAITKVIQLYETKNSRHSVMILGNTGTAKTVTWKTLKGSMGRLKKLNKPGFNIVEVFPINPKALNLGELYGEYNLATNEWLDGVISATMRTTCSDTSPNEKWILFDGPVDAVWIENMNSVMDDNKVLTLINSDRITMPQQVSLLFEVGDLSVASPATVSRCGMVYNDYKDWGWSPFVTSWIQKHARKGKLFQDVLKRFFVDLMGTTLEFRRLNCESIMNFSELNLVDSLCKLLDIFLTPENGVDPSNEQSFEDITKLWFLFCLVWSVCCTVDEEGRKKIDNFLREKEGVFPIKDTVYEYYVDVKNKAYSPWEEKLSATWRFEPSTAFYKIVVPTVDTVRYKYIVNTLLSRGHPCMLTGPVGGGKTSVAQSVLAAIDTNTYSVLNINMSAQTTSLNVQDTIESRVEKRTKGVFFPVGGKKMIIFLDDFNMPAKETYGSQPPLELLRQWIDYGFWYDRLKQTRKHIMNCFLLAAMGPPGGGRQMISERMLSKFCSIYMTFPSEAQIARIYGTMLSQHLQPFHIEVKALGKEITETTIELYNNVVAKMLPTPAKMHYLFNLRDISRVYQGLLRAHNEYTNTKPGILRLWVHESVRVFYDRLIDDKDRDWFLNHIHEQLGKHFELTLHSICPNWVVPTFGDFVNPWRIYEDLQDPRIVRKYIEGQMEQYNVSPGVVRMDLVLFADAIDHICRITRVISQPRGNVMLIGIGGSGRQSLSRIANYICEYNTFELTVSKSYRIPEFKEDLKMLYSATGGDNKQTGFLFNDTQVMDEGFLEIINNMLSTGEVANLYKPDEFEEIKNRIANAAAKVGVPYTTEALYTFFIERVRLNMHVILCMSPVGEAFRNRLRMYPALISCTTIDWFCDWPKEALIEVANKYIDGVDFVATITGEKLERRKESVLESSQDKLRKAAANMFSSIHDTVTKYATKMIQEMKRYSYVTPPNYLELVAGYKEMLAEKREEIASQANKLRNGLWKIEDCRLKVEQMSVELEEAQAKVEEFKVQCDEMIVIIAAQRREADEQQKEVTIKSIKIGEEEIQCKKLADLAQADLDEAMPALEEAIRALDALNKKDISEMKSYTKPPEKVKLVMEAVMILKQVDTSWEEAKRQLGDQYFLQGLREFDKNNISDKTMKKIHTYTTNPEFVPDKVGIVSVAAKSLCMWVIAIEKYAKVWRVVRPKKEKLDEALESLKEKQRLLAEAQAKLAELNMMLQKLQREYEEKLIQKEELDRKAEMLRLKLERAAMLVENLSGEKERWEQTVIDLKAKFNNLPGDCLLGIAFISYMGPFVTKYREDMVDRWKKEVDEQEIPFSSDFNVVNFLTDPTSVREWNIQGLPSDAFSTENGIIVVRGSRWPLVIDPQTQAQKWIKNMESKNDLEVIDLSTPRFMAVLERAIQFGKPVLLQNILEEMDPSLNPILNKAIVKQGGMELIKLDDKMVSYNRKFRLFITTKLTNPHYPPEISTKTSLINFAIKQQGLEAQLLGIVVRKEKPQLEIQKDEMVLTIARGKRALIDLENELLRLLNETRGSLLEDAELFNTLQVSKATAVAVVESLAISEETEIAIDLAREGYRPCAERASILFFVQNDMGKIDPMYQFSLDAYTLLFTQSIERSSKSSNLNDRINFLNDYHTYAVYKNTCRALFERHKLLFSFHMCVKILEALKKIIPAEYNFLLKGGVVLDRENQIDNPCSAWLSETAWDNITELDKVGGFHGVVNTFEQFPRDWHAWYIYSEPETLPLIGEWDDQCNEFQKMLFVRSLRSDRLSFSVSNFIINNLDPKFVEPPVLDIRSVLEESLPQTPLIFVLSTGVDPTASLIQLAEAFDMTPYFFSLSLGQGQAPIATRLIQIGIKEGHWVFLANCHLSLSWMPKLDKIVETIQYGKIHPDFRLWLSSSPHPDFPISILQAAIKMTTEPPKGIKANLKRLYASLTEDQFNMCKEKAKYKKLLFSLCYFHAVLLERKKFQQLGWNKSYPFNDSDFEVSEKLLSIYLDEYNQTTPWDALKYLIADINYGGHVSDDWDRRLLATYINQYFCEDALNVPFYRLSSLPTYYIPKDGSLQSYLNYIILLPTTDRPEAFGQNSNADITSLINETREMCETLMSLQIGGAAGSEGSTEEKVAQMAADILSKVPSPINYEETEKLMGYDKTPLDVVLLQEISRYNYLLNGMIKSLDELQKGIKGLVVMSLELEEIFICIDEGRVPSSWMKAYPSLKLLGSWTRDLIARVEHFAKWAETTHPPLLFWLSAYTFPTGFLTAVLQTAARAMEVPIDILGWEFTVLTLEENMIVEPPDAGVYIRGTFLEGAGWDKKNACLIDPAPMKLVYPMPVILFKPAEILKKKTRGLYVCPCYYYPIRCGVQGYPAFVVAVDLKSGMEPSDFWVKRATALILSLPT